jgi:hypothetical protein
MRTAWPPGPAAVRQSRLHELFFGLAQRAGAKDAKALAHQLVLRYDRAGIGAWPDRDPSAETGDPAPKQATLAPKQPPAPSAPPWVDAPIPD